MEPKRKRLPAEVTSHVKITLLPSASTPGKSGSGFFMTSYIVDDVVAIDAGTLGLLGDLNSQLHVRDVFLSHSHMDHIASLPIFLDAVSGEPGKCVTCHGSKATLDTLRRHVFNDLLWADFDRLASKGPPLVRFSILRPGQVIDVAGLRVTPIEVDHVVPTFGFLIEAPGASVAISSDTGPTEAIWRAARDDAHLKAVFLEASFPDAMHDLAVVSKHLTPSMFAAEFRKVQRAVPFIATHIKPRFYDEVVAELEALGLPALRIGVPGATYEFDAS
jgi:ribonuclease BN (tRNA processing enzyme)